MRKNRDVHVRMSDVEFEELRRKSRATCLTDSEYIRQLIMGIVPVTAPDEKFFAVMEIINEFSGKIDEIALKADNSVDMIAIMNEARKWRAFQNAVEKAFLRPRRIEG